MRPHRRQPTRLAHTQKMCKQNPKPELRRFYNNRGHSSRDREIPWLRPSLSYQVSHQPNLTQNQLQGRLGMEFATSLVMHSRGGTDRWLAQSYEVMLLFLNLFSEIVFSQSQFYLFLTECVIFSFYTFTNVGVSAWLVPCLKKKKKHTPNQLDLLICSAWKARLEA